MLALLLNDSLHWIVGINHMTTVLDHLMQQRKYRTHRFGISEGLCDVCKKDQCSEHGAEESVIVSEMSSFQCMQEWNLGWEKVSSLKCMQEWHLGWEKVSSFQRLQEWYLGRRPWPVG